MLNVEVQLLLKHYERVPFMVFPEILIAAGNKAFIYSVKNSSWRSGPTLPEPLIDLTSAQLEDGFLAMGGRIPNEKDSKTVYKFSEETYQWSLIENEILEKARYDATAVAVPDSFLQCH